MAAEPTPPSTSFINAWQKALNSRWFALFDLACVVVGILMGRLYPNSAGPLLLIALIPWGLRILSGRFPFRRTRLEGWIALFLVTALLGAIVGYQANEAWAKFWLLAGGVLLFFALAGQPAQNMGWIAVLFSSFAALVAGYFLLTYDWSLNPTRLALLNQAGLWWMKVRPTWIHGSLYHNLAAGIIVYSLPFTAVLALAVRRSKNFFAWCWLIFSGGLALIGFLMSSSRGALLALLVGCVVGLIQLTYEKQFRFLSRPLPARFKTPLILIFILAAGCAFLFLAGPVNLVESSPAFSSSGARVELFGSAIQLIQDFPFTGGGLSSFPGMYSRYILGIPYFFYLSSHNLFLNIAHEQGLLGLLALCGLYLTILIRILRAQDKTVSLLIAAALTCFVIALLHNLVDNILDDPGFAFLLFLLPGLIQAIQSNLPSNTQPETSPAVRIQQRVAAHPIRIGAAALSLVVMLALVGLFLQPLLGAAFANRGALRMAQIELPGFPDTQKNSGSHLAELEPAEVDFQQALRFNPANRTANHRLGLIALQRNDFQAAAVYLQAAHRVDETHRGITKALGFTYVWLGNYDLALPLLRAIPEAGAELDTYAFWWPTQNRPDLAEKATAMIHQLNLPH